MVFGVLMNFVTVINITDADQADSKNEMSLVLDSPDTEYHKTPSICFFGFFFYCCCCLFICVRYSNNRPSISIFLSCWHSWGAVCARHNCLQNVIFHQCGCSRRYSNGYGDRSGCGRPSVLSLRFLRVRKEWLTDCLCSGESDGGATKRYVTL